MVSVQDLLGSLTDESLRFATLAGLATVPFTVILSGEPEPHVIEGIPILLAGLVVGYVYSNRPTETSRAGIQTGFVASVGVVLSQLSYMVSVVWAESFEVSLVFAVLTPLVVIVGIGLSVLVGMASAIGSDWLVKKWSQVRSRGIGN